MKLFISIFVSMCVSLSSLFFGSPIAPPEKACILPEEKPSESEYIFDKIEGANGVCFYIGRPDETRLTEVNAGSFGMSEAKEDNTSELNAAFSYCAEHPNTRLVIPTGVYRFASDNAVCVFNCRGLLVDGNGSRFVFTSTASGNKILFRNSSFVEFRNLSTDWDWEKDPIGSLVKIVGENDKNHTVDLEFTEYDSVSESTVIKAMTICDPETFTMGADGVFKESYFYQQPDGIKKIEKIAPNVLRVTHNGSADYFSKGEFYMLRHHVYDGTVFRLEGESNNLTFDGISIYASGGMAFTVGGGCSRFRITNTYIGVEASKQNERHISLGADAIHIADSNGFFCIDGCDISGMGDDAINVHDNLAYVTEIVNSNTVRAIVSFNARVGTTAGFRDRDFNTMGLEAKITELSSDNGEMLITFDSPIGEKITQGCIFYDARCNSGNYVIRNNYFHENRARGLLLQSSNGLCENNRFYKIMGQAIKIVMDIQTGLWLEGTGVDNLVIRNNEFELCNYSSWGTVIDMGTNFDGRELKSQAFTNIKISDNSFIDCHEYILTVRSVNGIEAANNTAAVKNILKNNGKILIEDTAHNISVTNNTLYTGAVSRKIMPKCKGFRVWTDVLSNGKGIIC